LAAALSSTPRALAEPSDEDRAAAQALFEEAQTLKEEERFEEACDKFAASQKLDPAMGTQLNLADCYERIGRTASAWINFLEVASVAKKAGSPERREIANQRADALKPRLSRLQVTVDEPLEGMVVARAGEPIARPKWGSAVPVDPASYELTAEAPGYKPWKKIVTVEGEGALVEVTVPALEAAPGGGGAVPTEEGGSGAQIGVGIGLGVLGLVGVGVGAAFTVIASSKHDESLAFCPDDPNQCTQQGVDLRDEAQSAQTVSIVGFALGGAALVTGVVLLVTGLTGGDGGEPEAAAWQLSPAVGPDLAGLGLTVRF
jgi:serine/threonine-protein kinase